MRDTVDERELAVAGIYARSLLGLAREHDAADELEAELEDLEELLDRDPDLERFVASPAIDVDVKSRMLEETLRGRMSDLLVNGLQVMNRKGRLPLMRALVEAFRLALEEERGEIDVDVETALPLTAEQRERLAAAASRFSGRTARLRERVDASLLAGMVVRVGDRKIDTSAAKELRRLRKTLLERASNEILAGREYFAGEETAP